MTVAQASAGWIRAGLALSIVTLLVLAGIAVVVIPDEPGEAAQPIGAVDVLSPPTTVTPVPTPAPSTPSTAAARTIPTSRSARPLDTREVIVFMQPSATPADVQSVRSSLEAMTDVLSIRYVDKAEAYQEMKVLFAHTPGVMEKIDPIDAPENFHVLPRPGVDRHAIGARVEKRTRVLNVVYPGD